MLVSAATATTTATAVYTKAGWTNFWFRTGNPPKHEQPGHPNGSFLDYFSGKSTRFGTENPPKHEEPGHPNGSFLDHFSGKSTRFGTENPPTHEQPGHPNGSFLDHFWNRKSDPDKRVAPENQSDNGD